MKKTNLVIGKPDSGKTRGYMFNQVKKIISNGENLFIWDNKEEYYNYFYNDLKDSHYTIKMVRLDEPENSNGFNILSIPYSLYKRGKVDKALLLIQELGVSMVNTSDNVTDFWDNNARDLLCSLILLLFKEGKKEEIFAQIAENMKNEAKKSGISTIYVTGLFNDIYLERGYEWVKNASLGWICSKDGGKSYLISEVELNELEI